MTYTYYQAKRLRSEHLKELKALAPNLALTFNFGYRTDSIKAQGKMVKFFSMAQWEVFGRDWSTQYDRLWPVAYGYFEHPDTNPHYHVLAKVEWPLAEWMEAHGPGVWKGKLVRRGQLDFKEIYNPDGAWSYWTKRLVSRHGFDERWVYSDTRKSVVETPEKFGRRSGWL